MYCKTICIRAAMIGAVACPLSVHAAITAFWMPVPITQAAINEDPRLAAMRSGDLMVTTSGDWASAGMEAMLPTGFTYYNHTLGGNTKPNPAIVSSFPALAFDTYVTAPSDTGSSGAPVLLGGFPEPQPLSMSGNRLSVAWGNLQVDPPGTYQIARLTFRRGLTPFIPEGTDPFNWSNTSQVNPDATIFITSFPWMRDSLWLPDADGAWHVPANWSGGVPGASPSMSFTHHAYVNVGGPTLRTITHSEGNHTIQTLLSQEHIAISGGALTIGAYGRMSSGLTMTGGVLTGNDVLRVDGELSLWGDSAINLSRATTGFAPRQPAALINDYSGDSPFDTIRDLIISGYNNGAWNGTGIRSSTAASDPSFAVGYAEASELFTSFPATFMGETIDDTTVLVRLVRAGDANLDGSVNLADFNRLAANFGSTNAVWDDGDFNYDGITNLADFNLLAGNFGLSAGPDGPIPQDWAALSAAVPESGTVLACLHLFSAMLLQRSRRRPVVIQGG